MQRIALAFFSVIAIGTAFAAYNIYSHNHLAIVDRARTAERRKILSKGEAFLNTRLGLLPPLAGLDGRNLQFRDYKEARYRAGLDGIQRALSSKSEHLWMPLTAIVGQFVEDPPEKGFIFFELYWLDADSMVQAMQFSNDDGIIGRITFPPFQQNVYSSTAVHYDMFEIQDPHGPPRLIKNFSPTERGLIALPLSAFVKHPKIVLLDGSGHESEAASVDYIPMSAPDSRTPSATQN